MKDTKDTLEILTEKTVPEGIERFLASEFVEGIGPAYAHRLVETFGCNTLKVLAEDPEKCSEIRGLGESRALKASESLKAIKYPLPLLTFLFSCGVSEMYIDRILGKYRKRAETVILKDPYYMVENVWQLHFHTADKIGRAIGIAADDPRRLQAAIVGAVKHYADDGHLFATVTEALSYASYLTDIPQEEIAKQIDATIDDGRIVSSRGVLYLPVFYEAEKEGAEKLLTLAKLSPEKIKVAEIPLTDGNGLAYSPIQIEAIKLLLTSPVSVLTGGPGSGKTTVLRAVIDVLEKEGKQVLLCAPTGRAAKRMSSLTGREAYTIHRLLGYRQGEGYHKKRLETDVLIIDEGSMMEQVLFNHLLDAVGPGTQVMLVGDVDQLPAIGAGDVMRDMIKSPAIPVARLEENFRQEQGSMIAESAKAINSGEMPESHPESDFMIIPESTTKRIHNRILSLVAEELPREKGVSSTDILVVTPQQIGPLGAKQLNIDLQQRLNPDGVALRRGESIFRLGDPVMQTSNAKDRGVYNGETGRIVEVNPDEQTLTVEYYDGNRSTYKRSELSELTLAYATTVHKLQGCEVQNIVFPVTMAHKPMLYRNLLYTGISRASRLCVLVGEEEALRYAVENAAPTIRNSNFRHRLSTELKIQ
ncbi:MAG: ATP-dependent RecD-like DNA helicase [Muribaculaceae bacterium]|nr:ATP-dependent RecD-like DNA helicase [Muribaculaceae bacterium]